MALTYSTALEVTYCSKWYLFIYFTFLKVTSEKSSSKVTIPIQETDDGDSSGQDGENSKLESLSSNDDNCDDNSDCNDENDKVGPLRINTE